MEAVVLIHGTGGTFGRVTAYAARATVLLSFIFKFGHYNGIIQPATLIIPQNPRRNPYGPILLIYRCIILYTNKIEKSIAFPVKNGRP